LFVQTLRMFGEEFDEYPHGLSITNTILWETSIEARSLRRRPKLQRLMYALNKSKARTNRYEFFGFWGRPSIHVIQKLLAARRSWGLSTERRYEARTRGFASPPFDGFGSYIF
jgi:hypothetical protein